MGDAPLRTRILDLMYEEEMKLDTRFYLHNSIQELDSAVLSGLGNEQIDEISNELGADRENVRETLKFMHRVGLVERYEGEPDSGPVELSEKGFDIAHERQVRKKQEEQQNQRMEEQNDVNRAIGLLTIGLVFVSITNMVIGGFTGLNTNYWPYGPNSINIIIIFVMSVGSIVLFYLIYTLHQSGLLQQNTDW